VRPSYVPDQAQQELRDLTRTVRKLSQVLMPVRIRVISPARAAA
jgi:hypothetical protein